MKFRNHSSSNYSHDVPSLSHASGGKNIKPNKPPKNPILFFMPYEILNWCLFTSLDTLF